MFNKRWQFRHAVKKEPVSPSAWKTTWGPPRPTSVKAMQSSGMRTVPITLAQIPESRILTKEELK